MKIVDVGAVLLQPMPWVLVKVRTDEGIHRHWRGLSRGRRPPHRRG